MGNDAEKQEEEMEALCAIFGDEFRCDQPGCCEVQNLFLQGSLA